MSDPVLELIAENIKTEVAEITVANGFNQNLTPKRPTRSGWEDDEPATNGKVLIIQEDPDEDEENAAAGNNPMKAWVQPFTLVAFVIASDANSDPIDTLVNRVKADIEKKLCEDPTRGGNAWDTRIRAGGKIYKDGQYSGWAVVVDVHYRTREDDPYTKA